MVQVATLAIALAAAASSVSAFTVPCIRGRVYCGYALNSEPYGYTFPELQAAARAGGAVNPSIDFVQQTLFTCVNSSGGISTDVALPEQEDYCGAGLCLLAVSGQCPSSVNDCCKS